MFRERRVVDNRTFLLGLDKLYCDAMKRHERGELLQCARRVAEALHLAPALVSVEGYYAEDSQLTEYFRIVRALQDLEEGCAPAVAALPDFQRLREVMSAPLYGKPIAGDGLLPAGRDALSQALSETKPNWNVQQLTENAYRAAREMDDFSLVGLAALAKDALVLTAARESVVLYSEVVFGFDMRQQPPEYIWNVDKEVAAQARRFVDAFNTLFSEQLPAPEPAQAESYWNACDDHEILGRCVRLGYNNAESPVLQYHWAICRANDNSLRVQEFWHPEVWTTERYLSALRYGGLCPNL